MNVHAWLTLVAWIAVPWAAYQVVAEESRKPNVLLFFIDDLGRCVTGIDGSEFYHTPNLDRLARKGVRFTDFYSSHPVCSPTRAALMTGKAPQRLGITDWIHPASGIALPSEETTLAEAFRQHGYLTAYLGKWHLGESDADQPTHHGFQWTRGVNRAGQPGSYYFPFRRRSSDDSIWDVPDLHDGQPGDYLTDVLTDQAIRWLRHQDQQHPFFICIAHYAVHTPIQPPAGLPAKFRAKRQALYRDSPTPTRPAPFGATSRARQDDADYAAMIENLDANVGRVLDVLDERELRQNTIVVFTSDNGGLCTLGGERPGPTSNLPWRSGKGWHYEGGIRVPCYVSWPSHLKPATIEVPACTTDLYPTLLDLCGLPLRPQQHLDGRSLASALEGHARSDLNERSLRWYYPHRHGSGHRPSAAIRQGKWKLIHYFDNQTSELYNLDADPGESNDLSAQHLDRSRSLRENLERWIASTLRKSDDPVESLQPGAR